MWKFTTLLLIFINPLLVNVNRFFYVYYDSIAIKKVHFMLIFVRSFLFKSADYTRWWP
jgi:hypothetical protein